MTLLPVIRNQESTACIWAAHLFQVLEDGVAVLGGSCSSLAQEQRQQGRVHGQHGQHMGLPGRGEACTEHLLPPPAQQQGLKLVRGVLVIA